MKRTALALLLPLVTQLAGCITGTYSHNYVDEPIATARLEALVPGRDTLSTCLAALGAPNEVVEYQAEPNGRAGMVLVWYWQQDAGWGLDVSMPGSVPGGLTFKRKRETLPGCVLWFGSDFVLQQWRAGSVSELLAERVRPAFVDG
jgi:hypothetical protein